MPSNAPHSSMILAAGSTVLLLCAIYVAKAELSPLVTQGLSERTTVRSMAAHMLSPGLSTQSRIDFLYHCRVALTSLTGRAQPSGVRRTLLETCSNASEAMVADTPGFSAAWYTIALVASFEHNSKRMNDALAKSYATGPFEQWIAELRVDLVTENIDKLDASLLDEHMQDLRNLLSNDRGRRLLAPRYLALPTLKPQVDGVLPQIEEPARRRFLNIVQRLLVEKGRTNGR